MTAAAAAASLVEGAMSTQDVSVMSTPAKKTKREANEGAKVPVAVRMRPLPSKSNCSRVWTVDAANRTILQTDANGTHEAGMESYEYAHTFDDAASNQDVYDAIGKGVVGEVLKGYNGTIFTYGQTASGKTHTMQGSGKDRGLLQLAAGDIFAHIESERAANEAAQDVFGVDEEEEKQCVVKVSFTEIYNEAYRDLLVSGDAECKSRGFQATELVAKNMGELLEALAEGEKLRSVGSTKLNDRSSRSHAIVAITIESNGTTSTLNLVDLAGSESVRNTGATGERKKEAGHINQSLLALQQVIRRLGTQANGKGTGHVPYRDSKLTEFLKPSLEGAKLAVVCCATPSEPNETKSTLQFASRVGRVETKAVKNRPSIVQRWSVAPATPRTKDRASLASATTSKKAKRVKAPGFLSPKKVLGMLSPPRAGFQSAGKKPRPKTDRRPKTMRGGLFASIPEDAASDEVAESALQKDMRIAELKARLKISEEERASAQKKLQDQQAEREWLTSEKEELQAQVARLVSDGEFASAETQATLKSVEDELETAKENLRMHQAEVERVQSEHESTKAKLQGQDAEIEWLRSENEALKSQGSKAEDKINQKDQTIKEKNALLEEQFDVISTFKARIEGVTSQGSSTKHTPAAKTKKRKKSAEKPPPSAKQTEKDAKIADLEAHLQSANDELESTKRDLDSSRKELREKDELALVRSEKEELVAEDRRESHDSDATKELVEPSYKNVVEALDRAKAECFVLKDENERLHRELDGSKAKASMLEKELSRMTAERDRGGAEGAPAMPGPDSSISGQEEAETENIENETPNKTSSKKLPLSKSGTKQPAAKKRTPLGKALQNVKSPIDRRRGSRTRRKTDFLLNSEEAAPSASTKAKPELNVEFGKVGYRFRKNFKWYGTYNGEVVEELPGGEVRCLYSDDTDEIMSLEALKKLRKQKVPDKRVRTATAFYHNQDFDAENIPVKKDGKSKRAGKSASAKSQRKKVKA